ncbi:MAG: transglutaminase domain-containing protein [Planctomycetes bacterium]|nr:transglutaminase domain-containing protein [Planctomycetota bacterium]
MRSTSLSAGRRRRDRTSSTSDGIRTALGWRARGTIFALGLIGHFAFGAIGEAMVPPRLLFIAANAFPLAWWDPGRGRARGRRAITFVLFAILLAGYAVVDAAVFEEDGAAIMAHFLWGMAACAFVLPIVTAEALGTALTVALAHLAMIATFRGVAREFTFGSLAMLPVLCYGLLLHAQLRTLGEIDEEWHAAARRWALPTMARGLIDWARDGALAFRSVVSLLAISLVLFFVTPRPTFPFGAGRSPEGAGGRQPVSTGPGAGSHRPAPPGGDAPSRGTVRRVPEPPSSGGTQAGAAEEAFAERIAGMKADRNVLLFWSVAEADLQRCLTGGLAYVPSFKSEEYAGGHWRLPKGGRFAKDAQDGLADGMVRIDPDPSDPSRVPLVQDCRMAPNGTRLLYAAGRPLSVDLPEVWVDNLGRVRLAATPTGWTNYRVRSLLPDPPGRGPRSPDPAESANNLLLPDGLTNLKEFARAADDDGLSRRDRIARLTAAIQRVATYSREEPKAAIIGDPTEYFLFTGHRGSCTQFASALALCLRAVGIEARFSAGVAGVTGLRKGGAFVFRGANAHAWVEAFVSGDGWTIVDPTPKEGRPTSSGAGAAEEPDEPTAPPRDVSRMMEEYGWREGVGWKATWDAIVAWLGRLWPVLWRVLLGLGIAAAVGVVYLRARRRGWTGLLEQDEFVPAGAPAPTRRVPFYEEFERLARRIGYRRDSPDTPMEFAGRIETAHPSVAARGIAERLYAVRFGGVKLAAGDLAAVKQALLALRGIKRRQGAGDRG